MRSGNAKGVGAYLIRDTREYGMSKYRTMDDREVTSYSNTLEEAIQGAKGAWWNGSDNRLFCIVNASGSTVAVVQRARVTKG